MSDHLYYQFPYKSYTYNQYPLIGENPEGMHIAKNSYSSSSTNPYNNSDSYLNSNTQNNLQKPKYQYKSPNKSMGLGSNKSSQQKLKKNSSLRYSYDINAKSPILGGSYLHKLQKPSFLESQNSNNFRFAFNEEGAITKIKTENNQEAPDHKTVMKTEIDDLKAKIKLQNMLGYKKLKSHKVLVPNGVPLLSNKSSHQKKPVAEVKKIRKYSNTIERMGENPNDNSLDNANQQSMPVQSHYKANFFASKPQANETKKTKEDVRSTFSPYQIKNQRLLIQDFILDKKLGNGKYGAVYKAIHIKTGSVYAIKKISKSVIQGHKMIDQFILETKIQKSLRNENIVQLYCVFDDKQNIYMVEEYMPDGSLLAKLKKVKSFPEQQVSVIIKQIVNSIGHMREKGIVHRDIKPENIVLNGEICKLCDFGWATHCKDNERRSTFCGTFDYTAPELLQGEQYGQAVDLWCLGILTYELLVGKPPFYHISRKQTVQNIKNANLHKINYPKDTSVAIKSFISSLLRKNPEQRSHFGHIAHHPFLQLQETS